MVGRRCCGSPLSLGFLIGAMAAAGATADTTGGGGGDGSGEGEAVFEP